MNQLCLGSPHRRASHVNRGAELLPNTLIRVRCRVPKMWSGGRNLKGAPGVERSGYPYVALFSREHLTGCWFPTLD